MMATQSFFGGGMAGQDPWALRGEDEGRIRSLETTLAAFNLKLAGFGATLSGTPTLASPFKLQAATLVGSSDVNGYLNWTYPVVFPGGLVAVLVSNGDVGSPKIRFLVDVNFTTTTLASIRFIDTTTGAVATAYGPVRLNLLAIGW